jgi:hypothetical protein
MVKKYKSNLNEYTVEQLKDIARYENISHYSGKNKKELIKHIDKHLKIKKKCDKRLSDKIKTNIKEYKSPQNKFISKEQAIAVSYSQINKKYPECEYYYKK